MAFASFSKHATFQNRSYLPIDKTDLVSQYSSGLIQGQRLSIYYPSGSPSDYAVNRTHTNRWAWMLFTVNNTFILSQRDFADATAFAIDTTTASTGGVDAAGALGQTCVTAGVLWQCLMNGIAVVAIQVTATASSGNTGGTTPISNGAFHLPGGASGLYESLNHDSARKDVIYAVQHCMEFADTFELCRDAWGMIGTSGGADTLAWTALAPSRAFELGSHGRYQWNTVPNVFVASNALLINVGIMKTTVAGLMFPTTETGFTIATTLAGVPARYIREASADFYISDMGEDCIPPTFYHGDVATQSGNFGMPFTNAQFNVKFDGSAVTAGTTLTITTATTYLAGQTLTLTASNATFQGTAGDEGDVWRLVGADGATMDFTTAVAGGTSTTVNAGTAAINVPASLRNVATTNWYRVQGETNAHTIWHGLALRGMFGTGGAVAGRGRVYLATGSSGVTSTDGNSLAQYVDRFDMTTPPAIDTDGVAGLAQTTDGTYKAIDHILANINKPRWDAQLPARGIARRGQVNARGRYCVPPRSDRAGVIVECQSRPELGHVDLLWGTSPSNCMNRIRRGDAKEIKGGGPIWLCAAGDLSKVARYTAREVARL